MNDSESEAIKSIRNGLSVTRQMIVVAKAIIFDSVTEDRTSQWLVERVLEVNQAKMPEKLVIHPTVDPTSAIHATSEALSWRLAACEAILSLIHSNVLIALTPFERCRPTTIVTTTVVPGSGGTTGGHTFDEMTIALPGVVRRAPSLRISGNQFLTDADLYLNALDSSGMHPEICAAFREAATCLKHELFTAALAMLGKASEGAWLELGGSLLAFSLPEHESTFRRQRSVLEDPNTGTMRKIDAVLTIYERQDMFNEIVAVTGIRPQELRSVALWSDTVRDSRNTIHFGSTPASPNNYEKVAVLFLAAPQNVRVLYRIKNAADAGHVKSA